VISQPAVGRRRRFVVVAVVVVAAVPVAALGFAWWQWRAERAQAESFAIGTVYYPERGLLRCQPSTEEGALPRNFNSCVSTLEQDLDLAESRRLCPAEDIARARAVLAQGRAEWARKWPRMP
jgi:hypothetical protein